MFSKSRALCCIEKTKKFSPHAVVRKSCVWLDITHDFFWVMSWGSALTSKDLRLWLGNEHCLMGYSDSFDGVSAAFNRRTNCFLYLLKPNDVFAFEHRAESRGGIR